MGRFLAPGHDWHCGNAVGWCAVNQFSADAKVDQCAVSFVPHPHHPGFFEKHRGVFAEHHFVFGKFGGQCHRPCLAAGERELAGVFGQPQCAADASCAGLTDMACHPGYLGVGKSFHAHLVVGANQLPGGGDAANGFRVCSYCAQ